MRSRCRNFNSAGERREGQYCRPNCPFVHPDNPDWSRAPEYRFDEGRGRGRGRGKGGFRDRDRNDDFDRSRRSSSSSTGFQWDARSWGVENSSHSGVDKKQPYHTNSPTRRRDSNSTAETSKQSEGSQLTGWDTPGWGAGPKSSWTNTEGNKDDKGKTTGTHSKGWGDAYRVNPGNGWGDSTFSAQASGSDKVAEKTTTTPMKGWGPLGDADIEEGEERVSAQSGGNSKEPPSSVWGSTTTEQSSWGISGFTSKGKEVLTSSGSGWGPSAATNKTMALEGRGSAGDALTVDTQPRTTGWGSPPATHEEWGDSSSWDLSTFPKSTTTHSVDPKPPLSTDVPGNTPDARYLASSIGKPQEKRDCIREQVGWSPHVESRNERNGDMAVDQLAGPSAELARETRTNNSPPPSPYTSLVPTATSPLTSCSLRIQTNALDRGGPDPDNDQSTDMAFITPHTPYPNTPASNVPTTRSEAFVRYMKDLIAALWYKHEVESLEPKDKAWVRAQKSQEYQKASPKVAQILNQQRSDFKHPLIESQKRLKERLRNLKSLPNFDDPAFLPEFDVGEAKSYLAQLRRWVDEGKLYQRFLDSERLQGQPTTVTEPTTTASSDTFADPLQDIKESISKLDNLYEQISDDIFLQKITHFFDSDDTGNPIPLVAQPKVVSELNKITTIVEDKDTLLHLSQRKADVGVTLQAQRVFVADLLRDGANLDNELSKINEKLISREAICRRAEETISRIEKEQQEDEKKIRELELKLKKVLETPRAPPPPISPERLLPIIRNIILEQYSPMIKEAIVQLDLQAQETHQKAMEDVTAQLTRTLEISTNLHTRAREATGVSNANGSGSNLVANASNAAH